MKETEIRHLWVTKRAIIEGTTFLALHVHVGGHC